MPKIVIHAEFDEEDMKIVQIVKDARIRIEKIIRKEKKAKGEKLKALRHERAADHLTIFAVVGGSSTLQYSARRYGCVSEAVPMQAGG